MPDELSIQNKVSAVQPRTSLTIAGLIRLELKGKDVALDRYDSILWKIRSGYIIVLYGALSLLVGKGLDFAALGIEVLLLVCGFSTLGYIMDFSFLARQLRVVAAKNLLIDQAVELATGENVDVVTLRELLHIAGESHRKVGWGILVRATLPVLLFYQQFPEDEQTQ